jgi:hypothetical protein
VPTGVLRRAANTSRISSSRPTVRQIEHRVVVALLDELRVESTGI